MTTAIRAGKLFDGSGDVVENAVIIIEDGRFEIVDSESRVDIPSDAFVIDAQGKTVIPGLIDCHVHLVKSGDPDDKDSFQLMDMTMSIPEIAYNMYENALRDLRAGFTTLRDASARHFADIALRDAINSGRLVGPRLWTSGMGITSTFGHMDRAKHFAPHVTLPDSSMVADGPVEALRHVRHLVGRGVDFIKINATLSEHVRRYGGTCSAEMTYETVKAICDEAHRHNRKVIAHTHGGEGTTWALEAGLDEVDHGFFLDDAQLEMMAEKGVALCPTLSVMGRSRDLGDIALTSANPDLKAWRRKAEDAAWDMVGRAHRKGVTIICGSDAAMPCVIHGTNAYELEMLTEAGLSPAEALMSGTGTAADVLGIPDVGRIQVGNLADAVVVNGDPLEDITILQDMNAIELVLKDGEVVSGSRSKGVMAAREQK